MAAIFVNAATVLIWLGIEDENTIAALQLARRLIKWEDVLSSLSDILGSFDRRDPFRPWTLHQNHPGYFSEEDWFAFLSPLKNDWFRRA